MVRRAKVEVAQSLVEMVRRAEVEETHCHWLKWLGEQRLRWPSQWLKWLGEQRLRRPCHWLKLLGEQRFRRPTVTG